MMVQYLPRETGNCASLLAPEVLRALLGRRENCTHQWRGARCCYPPCWQRARSHQVAQNRGILGHVDKLNMFVHMVSVLQIPNSARAFDLYKNLMLIRRDG